MSENTLFDVSPQSYPYFYLTTLALHEQMINTPTDKPRFMRTRLGFARMTLHGTIYLKDCCSVFFERIFFWKNRQNKCAKFKRITYLAPAM